MRALCLALLLAAARPVSADPAPPMMTAAVDLVSYGIYCRPAIQGREAAPETAMGFVNILEEEPAFRHAQGQVPAALGVSFGFIVVPRETHLRARMETWKPGAAQPEIWFTDLVAGARKTRGFSFETQDELITGLWRMEAWDGDTRLYSVEFEVLPAEALPGITSDCDLLS